MTTSAPPASAIRWRVPIVQVSSNGDRSEIHVEVEAADQIGAWLAAQQLPDMPAESDSCHYATPVRIRTVTCDTCGHENPESETVRYREARPGDGSGPATGRGRVGCADQHACAGRYEARRDR